MRTKVNLQMFCRGKLLVEIDGLTGVIIWVLKMTKEYQIVRLWWRLSSSRFFFPVCCVWLLVLLAFVVSWQYAATIVLTRSKTSMRHEKTKWYKMIMLYKSNETIQKSANYRFQLQHVANSKDMCPRLKNKTTSPKNATTSSPQNICTYI